jgi:hypothetical protein
VLNDFSNNILLGIKSQDEQGKKINEFVCNAVIVISSEKAPIS